MRCKDFLALHTDFRDGTITDPSMDRRMRRHEARCRSCAQYVKALEVGTAVLRQTEVEPSARFRVNLRVRMALENRRRRPALPPMFGWPARAAATALVVTGIAAGFAQRKDKPTQPIPTQIVATTPAAESNQPTVRMMSSPEFELPPFDRSRRNARQAAPHVTFTMSEDSGFRAVPATFAR